MSMNILFYVGVLLLIGLLGGFIIKRFKLPAVTGYLVAGLLFGPYVGNLIPLEVVESLKFLSNVALGFIAFSIGSEFKISYFRKVGMTPIVIAICEALFAVFFVTIALLLTGNSLPFSLMLGAIASATAPAATIMVIRQYKAKGPVTETLLSVVAIDDAVALISFAIATAIAQLVMNGGQGNLITSLFQPIKEIVLAIGIGGIMGIIFMYFLRYIHGHGNQLGYTVAFILVGVGIARTFALSELLLCMAFGAIFTNLYNNSDEILNLAEGFTPPLLMIFFVLSGTELNWRTIFSLGSIGLVYILVRIVGKISGARFGARIMKADEKITKWLGPCLIPQAGVAIGLSLVAQRVVPEFGNDIRSIILCATLIYELFGPAITKYSLSRAGEIIHE